MRGGARWCIGGSFAAHPAARTIPRRRHGTPSSSRGGAKSPPTRISSGLAHLVEPQEQALRKISFVVVSVLPINHSRDHRLPRIFHTSRVLFALGVFTRDFPPVAPFLNL